MALFTVDLNDFMEIKAETQEEAEELVYDRLNDLASSNDGSEALANTDFTVRKIKD